ncbi:MULTISPECIES: bifunctional alpha/beta hydrolase/OsmC family protein [unclassified Sphingopyxis]|uniref:bifunctional alpha/beta hydrolase/OsmC family protein n=1 Tax=unclassified Sphingopyxis TaxID=2614943 RepID=UPI0006C58144|nr:MULTISPECIES: bifunctional alpha/beta hydrolase/OsmC family protein [unclassified Sphingopyxis]USI78304.1 bifunctional alpha/beta hydrolase/OsmC family protein [Sphingopyxis sp. USTB-05]GAO79302.1 bll2902 protein [Sphingopyxis sp. C-1]
MPTRPFDFPNGDGERLSGRLELPVGSTKAWALFAHCFTCGKDNKAAVRISRRLAGAGIGVLRFDFTGLGASEGDFGSAGFSHNVKDLVAAADAMTAAGMPPMLLVGHSLGGAAVLAAAGSLPGVHAIATIAAPFDVEHALHQFDPEGLETIEREGRGVVAIGSRPFTVRKEFVKSLREQDQGARVASLKRPLLLLHSPIDQVVGIENVTSLYLAAKHPKSFVSLDGADHLLTDARDADFAADMISAWAGRYLPAMPPTAASQFDAEAEETRLGKFQLAMRAGKAAFIADEPESAGGLGSGPTPFNLLSAALAACTTMTLRLYADRKGWPVDRIRTGVTHRKDKGFDKPDIFSRRVEITGAIDDAQHAELLGVADRCPVHRTLETGSRFEATEAGWADAGPTGDQTPA